MLSRFLSASSLVTLSLAFLTSFSADAQSLPNWKVTKTSWSADDESRFGEFVKALGYAKCGTVHDCLRSSANPYRNTDPADSVFWSDCADLPYFLRAYFAWKNELPFSYISAVGAYPDPNAALNLVTEYEEYIEEVVSYENTGLFGLGPKKKVVTKVVRLRPKPAPVEDLRYSKAGNFPRSRSTVAPSRDGSFVHFFQSMTRMQNTVSTAFFRFHPEMNVDIDTDFYPIEITRRAVRPGTVAYGPAGHVAIVYDVTSDGKILLFNAHPGNPTPVSRTIFETRTEYMRSKAAHGSGLKNWRPFELVGAQSKNGQLIGGRLVFAQNSQLADYSTEQFYGTNRSGDKSLFVVNGQDLTYEKFIRARLTNSKIDPVKDFERKMNEACQLMITRDEAVQQAVRNGISSQPHPAIIPPNIFSASGDWEDYSTPSRDLRLRQVFENARLDLIDQVAAVKKGDPTYVSTPNMRSELLKAFKRVNDSCQFTYTNSDGKKVPMNLEKTMWRLHLISFDPYHCPELRWGASSKEELASCRDNKDKRDWYAAQQGVRNYLSRNWTAPNQISQQDLWNGNFGFSSTKVPNMDVKSFVEKLDI